VRRGGVKSLGVERRNGGWKLKVGGKEMGVLESGVGKTQHPRGVGEKWGGCGGIEVKKLYRKVKIGHD